MDENDCLGNEAWPRGYQDEQTGARTNLIKTANTKKSLLSL